MGLHCPRVVVGLAAVGVHIDGYHVVSSFVCWYGIITLFIAIVASALPYFLERLDLIFLLWDNEIRSYFHAPGLLSLFIPMLACL